MSNDNLIINFYYKIIIIYDFKFNIRQESKANKFENKKIC